MKKTILGAVVGGFILFMWSVLAWVILPFNQQSIHKIPNEDFVITALQFNLPDKGLYLFPKRPGMSGDQASMDTWEQKTKRGPIGIIIYNPMGADPMMPSQMVVGLILDILTALVITWFLLRSTAAASSYIARVSYCGMFGIFVSAFTHLMNWNWMGYPADFTFTLIIDGIVGCLLAGLGIAAIVKPPTSKIA